MFHSLISYVKSNFQDVNRLQCESGATVVLQTARIKVCFPSLITCTGKFSCNADMISKIIHTVLLA